MNVLKKQNIAELCKGSTTDSDSVCLGSNPSPAAKNRQGSTESCRFYYFLFTFHLYCSSLSKKHLQIASAFLVR